MPACITVIRRSSTDGNCACDNSLATPLPVATGEFKSTDGNCATTNVWQHPYRWKKGAVSRCRWAVPGWKVCQCELASPLPRIPVRQCTYHVQRRCNLLPQMGIVPVTESGNTPTGRIQSFQVHGWELCQRQWSGSAPTGGEQYKFMKAGYATGGKCANDALTSPLPVESSPIAHLARCRTNVL
jgi:hypothetical protein